MENETKGKEALEEWIRSLQRYVGKPITVTLLVKDDSVEVLNMWQYKYLYDQDNEPSEPVPKKFIKEEEIDIRKVLSLNQYIG